MLFNTFGRKAANIVLKTLCLLFLAQLTTQCTETELEDMPALETVSPQLFAEFEPMRQPMSERAVTDADGKVSWEASDRLMVFVAPAGHPCRWNDHIYQYVTNETDCQRNLFTPSVDKAPSLTYGQPYDWYVMSPYNEKVTDPTGGTNSATEFSFDGQTQNALQPMAHLTAYDVMTGVMRNVKAEEAPQLRMEHKAALMAFNIVNEYSADLTLKKIEFEASEGIHIGGSYSIDFGPGGHLTPKRASHQTTLTLENTQPLAPGESYMTYIVMPSFTIAKGKSFAIRVYTDKGVVEQKMSPKSSAIQFIAGSINRATVRMKQITPAPPQSKIVFAEGVTRQSGWYDVNKKKDGRTGKDGTMCWAATAANMLEWWQDCYKRVNHHLPAQAVSGKGKEYELAIFEEFQKNWHLLEHGSEVYYGIPWYFTGENLGKHAAYTAQPNEGSGGYFSSVWSEIAPLMGKKYTYDINAYGTWGHGWGADTSRRPLEIFTQHVVEAFKEGMASISIKVGGGQMHAITLWGYELNDEGMVKRVFVTDSDDMLRTPNKPRESLMQIYEVTERLEQREVGILGAYDGYNMISQIVPFKGYHPVK